MRKQIYITEDLASYAATKAKEQFAGNLSKYVQHLILQDKNAACGVVCPLLAEFGTLGRFLQDAIYKNGEE